MGPSVNTEFFRVNNIPYELKNYEKLKDVKEIFHAVDGILIWIMPREIILIYQNRVVKE